MNKSIQLNNNYKYMYILDYCKIIKYFIIFSMNLVNMIS